MNFKVVIAVNTGDFFNDVSLDCNILCCSPAWNRYAEVIVVELNLKAEAFECCNNSVVADFNACVAVNKVFVKVKNNCVIPECVLVCERRNNLDVAVILLRRYTNLAIAVTVISGSRHFSYLIDASVL